MSNWINANYGVVRSVSSNKSTIKVAMPRGGVLECRNEGFEIGQSVCFILDALKRRIVKLWPNEVADVQLLLGLNPELQYLLQPKPTDIDIEEVPNGEFSDASERRSDEEYLDLISRMDREEYTEWDSADRAVPQE